MHPTVATDGHPSAPAGTASFEAASAIACRPEASPLPEAKATDVQNTFVSASKKMFCSTAKRSLSTPEAKTHDASDASAQAACALAHTFARLEHGPWLSKGSSFFFQ
eukprot:TRINITY_DN50699_c0_g1_i1.p2 TRINITY_DN50699_c0_g1~~TRINITY_DN50699_c0_g1_i1.p2  ORF type:complete len:107 (+),score=17.57 TRINITY_DN50699_c0_g1_i1:495-815(+)